MGKGSGRTTANEHQYHLNISVTVLIVRCVFFSNLDEIRMKKGNSPRSKIQTPLCLGNISPSCSVCACVCVCCTLLKVGSGTLALHPMVY